MLSIKYFGWILCICLLGCNTEKKVTSTPSEPRLSLESATFQEQISGTQNGETVINLRFLISVSPADAILDSVYFNGYKQQLSATTADFQTIYKAKIYSMTGQRERAPVPVLDNQAVIVTKYEGKRFLSNAITLKEKEPVYAP